MLYPEECNTMEQIQGKLIYFLGVVSEFSPESVMILVELIVCDIDINITLCLITALSITPWLNTCSWLPDLISHENTWPFVVINILESKGLSTYSQGHYCLQADQNIIISTLKDRKDWQTYGWGHSSGLVLCLFLLGWWKHFCLVDKIFILLAYLTFHLKTSGPI